MRFLIFFYMKKILIVLNDAILLTTFNLWLPSESSKTNEVILVENSLAAVKVLEKNRIDLLITDIAVSKFDAFDLLVYLARKAPQTRVLILLDFFSNSLSELSTIQCIEQDELLHDLGTSLKSISQDKFSAKRAEEMIAVDFFQLVNIENKTCLLEVGCKKGKGLVYFYQGELFDGFCSSNKGEQAILNMFETKCSLITVKELPKKMFRQKIKVSLKNLVDEGDDFQSEKTLEVKMPETDKQRTLERLKTKVENVKGDENFKTQELRAKTKITTVKKNDLVLEESLKTLQVLDGHLVSAIFDMSGEVLVQQNNSDYDVDLIGENAIKMISNAVKAMKDSGLGACDFIQVNSEKGIFGAVWAVEDEFVVAVLLESGANVAMAKLMLEKVGELAGSRLA